MSDEGMGKRSSQQRALVDRDLNVMRINDDTINLREFLTVIRGGKWIIAAITAAILFLAGMYAFLAKPVYQTNGLIQIQQQNQPGSATDVLSFFLPMAEPAQAEISIMTSRAVLGPVVKKQHLNIVTENSGIPIISHVFGSSDVSGISLKLLHVPDDWKDQKLILKSLGNNRYSLESPSGDSVLKGTVGKIAKAPKGQVQILVTKLDVPAGEKYKLVRLYDQEAIEDLQKNLSAKELGNDTGIVQLTLNGHDPSAIKSTLNAIEDQYMNQNVKAMASQAQKSLVFVRKELPQLKSHLDSAQDRLTKFMQNNGAVALDQQSQILLQELTALQSQLAQVKMAEAAMRQRYTANFPSYKALKSQEQEINEKINSIQGGINLLPEKEQSYLDLTQHVQVYQQLYTALLSKAQDLQVAQAGTVGSARIVDHAVLPIKPIEPRKFLIMFMSLLMGLFIGVIAVFMRRALSQAIEDPAVLEQEFNLPVYGVIPHSKRQMALIKKAKKVPNARIPILFDTDPRDPVVESIRSMRTAMSFAMMDRDEKIISIGGCAPDAGKSFLSMNLAHVAGSTGARTLLIDADMRRGHLEEYMNGIKSPGLSEILSREIDVESVVQQSPYGQNVEFIPSGKFPPNPYELLSRNDLSVLFKECAKKYDLVIVDVPPILSVADGAIIAKITTTNFLVVRSGSQNMREVRLGLSRFEQNGGHVMGFILNDLSAEAQSHSYGKYGAAYTRYRYDRK